MSSTQEIKQSASNASTSRSREVCSIGFSGLRRQWLHQFLDDGRQALISGSKSFDRCQHDSGPSSLDIIPSAPRPRVLPVLCMTDDLDPIFIGKQEFKAGRGDRVIVRYQNSVP